MTVDLHMHTYHSDGTWSPEDLVAYAIEKKLRYISVTDHDSTSGITEARACAGNKIEIIAGVEVNSIYRNADGSAKDVHILGYFIDPLAAPLQKLLERQRTERRAHAERLVARMQAEGMPITLEKVQSFAGHGAVGKMHIAQAIIAVGGAQDATEAYNKYLTRGSAHYEERHSVSPHEAIQGIVASGGIASIAHPGKEDDAFSLIIELKEAGLRCIEAHHRIHSADRVKQYIRFAERNDMLITGGSDCHGPFKEYEPVLGTVTLPMADFERLRQAVPAYLPR